MSRWLVWTVLILSPVPSCKAFLLSSSSSSSSSSPRFLGTTTSATDAADRIFYDAFSSSSTGETPSTHHHSEQHSRFLENGDFDELNQLLQNVKIRWPQEDTTVADDVVKVTLSNTVCFDFSIQDMQWQHEPLAQSTTTSLTTTTTTRLTLSLQGLDFSCTLDYRYSFLFSRSGTASLDSFNNEATLTMDIVVVQSQGDDNVFEHYSNNTTTTFSTHLLPVTNCDPVVQITDLQITSGSISSVVWDAVLRLMRNQMEEQAAEWICRQWQDYATKTVNPGLQHLDDILAQYIHSSVNFLSSQQDLDQSIIPPSVEEEEGEAASVMTLLDFQQEQGLFAVREWVRQVFQRAVMYLTQPIALGDSASNLTTPTNLQVNTLLRDHVLDADGGYRVELNNTVYDGTDRLTHTRVLLERIHIFGLDTVTALTPLKAIGPQTVQMDQLALEYLRFELDVLLDIQPSTRSDSLIVNSDEDEDGDSSLQESVKIQFSLSNVQIRASLLIALNEDILGSLPLGQLLHSDRIMACFLSTVYALDVGGLSVQVGDVVEPPVLVGFVSPGTDRIVSSAIDAAFAVYQEALLEALPGLFHIEVRQWVNQFLASELAVLQLEHQGQCSITDFQYDQNDDEGAFIDFRDLLLPPEQAVAAGGSGTQPYGDLVSRTWQELQQRWIVPDDNEGDGSPGINELIRSFIEERYSTLSLSEEIYNNTNIDNTLYFDNVFFSSNSTLKVAGLEAQVLIQLLDVRVNNLDSFGSPLRILDPKVGLPHTLRTMVSVGTNSKNLELSTKLLLSISDGKEMSFRNEVAIQVDLGTTSVVLDLLAQILETPFFSVPLRDMLNANCWIAAVLPLQSSSSTERGKVQIVREEIAAESLFLNFSCVACSSPDFEELAYKLYSPDRSGNATATLFNLLELFKQSQYLENLNGGVVELAAKQCPHNPDYDPDASYSTLFRAGEAGSLLVEPKRDKRAHVFNVVSALIAICFTLLYIVGRRMANNSFTSWKESATEDGLEQLRIQESSEREEEAELNSCTESMYRSPTLLPREHFGFPAALVLTIGLQLCGHLALLSTVTLSGQVAGEPFVVHDFLEFSFFTALQGAGNNGGPEMAILAFVFTGIWPYVKLATSLALWFSPPDRLSVSRRGSILLWLDVFAKLSVVDIVTILFAVGAFLIYFGGLDQSLQADGQFFAIKAIVKPGFGCYTIVMAQRILRITSRFMIECHQRIIAAATTESSERRVTFVPTASSSWEFSDDDVDDAPDSRCSSDSRNVEPACKVELEENKASRSVPTSSIQPRHRKCQVNFLTVFAGLTVVLIGMIGAFLAPAVSIDTKAVWQIVGSGRTYAEAVSEMAVFEVITEILLQSRVALNSVTDYIGLGFLLFLVVVVGAAFPVMKGVAKFRRWTGRQRIERVDPIGGRISLRTSLVRTASVSFKHIKSTCKVLHFRCRLRMARSQSSEGANAMELLPFYRVKAWRQMEVYLSAFVIACWQLGAVAAYTIHLYCYFMEMIFKSLENLGLVQKTSAQCFRNQLMEPSTMAVVCVGFFVLLGSSIFAAKSHYNNIIRSAHCNSL